MCNLIPLEFSVRHILYDPAQRRFGHQSRSPNSNIYRLQIVELESRVCDQISNREHRVAICQPDNAAPTCKPCGVSKCCSTGNLQSLHGDRETFVFSKAAVATQLQVVYVQQVRYSMKPLPTQLQRVYIPHRNLFSKCAILWSRYMYIFGPVCLRVALCRCSWRQFGSTA